MLFLLSVAACSWRSEPCPVVDRVLEEGAADALPLYNGDPHRLVITGEGFSALPGDVRGDGANPLLPEVHVGEVLLTELVWAPDALTATLPGDATLAPGVYDLTVTNPAGCAVTVIDAVTITDTPPPRLDDSIRVDFVTPPFGWTDARTAITISGAGFVSTPYVYLSLDPFVPGLALALDQVAFIGEGSLAAVVPEGLPVGGPYDLVVLNPDNGYNLLEDAFTVTALPPPDVRTVLPQAGTTQEDTAIVIEGEHFEAGATVVLLRADGTEVSAPATVGDEGHIDATVPSATMTVGSYLVRVRNPDGSYDDHAAFVVRNPSAKLGTDGSWAAGAPMNVARAAPGLLASVDTLGRGWLWAIAGDDGAAPLASVERAQLDAFGVVSGWARLGGELTTPRADAAYVVHDGFVWAIGGDDGTGALDTVERAAILDGEAGIRPEIVDAEALPGPGTLAPGTWYYRVSALLGSDDPWNPDGETLASEVAVVRLGLGEVGVGLSWAPVPGAVAYRVYRTDAVDGAAGQEQRVADGIFETTWVDDGVAPGTVGFVPDGGLGRWVELADRLPAARSHAAAVVAKDPAGVTWVWLVGGTTDGGTPAAEVWALDADGAWFDAGTLGEARMDHDAVAVGFDEALELGAGAPTYLVAIEGSLGDGADSSIEYATILPGGLLSGFGPLSNTDANGQARMDHRGLGASGWLYVLGGGGSADEAQDSGRQSSVDGPDLEMGSWSSSSDSGTFGTPRADFGLATVRATLYAVGGRTDAAAATDTIEQVVY
ncbi:MAG: kelch repeat-containing protein [Myxococcota bacterium]